jgi:hypothetical protein
MDCWLLVGAAPPVAMARLQVRELPVSFVRSGSSDVFVSQ